MPEEAAPKVRKSAPRAKLLKYLAEDLDRDLQSDRAVSDATGVARKTVWKWRRDTDFGKELDLLLAPLKKEQEKFVVDEQATAARVRGRALLAAEKAGKEGRKELTPMEAAGVSWSNTLGRLAARHTQRLKEIDYGVKSDAEAASTVFWGRATASRKLLEAWEPGVPLRTGWHVYQPREALPDWYLPSGHREDARIVFTPHARQAEWTEDFMSGRFRHATFRVARRAGKSIWATALADLFVRTPTAWGMRGDGSRPSSAEVLITGVTHAQLTDIYWESGLVDQFFQNRADVEDIFPSKKIVTFRNGSLIRWAGSDNKGAREGTGPQLVIIDECGLTPDLMEYLDTTIEPMLMDSGGRIIAIGVPKGGGTEYNDLEDRAHASADWACYSGSSVENPYLPLDKVQSTIDGIDRHIAQQEVFAEWVSRSLGCWDYDEKVHLDESLEYDPSLPLDIFFDFNIRHYSVGFGQRPPTGEFNVLDYIQTEQETRTLEVVQQIMSGRWGPKHHRGRVRVFGDATGGRGSTSSKAGYSDWAIIEEGFRAGYKEGGHVWRYRDVGHHREASNPDVIDRMNSVNAALRPGGGQVLVRIHPRCHPLRKDLQRQKWDPEQRVPDKKQEKRGIGHAADGFGYWVYTERPISGVTWFE